MIKLIENFYIEVSGDQYTLVRIKEGEKKDGTPTETKKVYGYYGKIEECLFRCRRECFAEGLADRTVSLSEAIESIKEIKARLEDLVPKGVF